MILGVEKMVKQIEQVISDDSLCALLMYRDKFWQQALGLASMSSKLLSFSFPIGKDKNCTERGWF
jgi:hypothetical protein